MDFGLKFCIITQDEGTNREETKKFIESHHADLHVTDIVEDVLDANGSGCKVLEFYVEFDRHLFVPLGLIMEMNLKADKQNSFVYWALED